MSKRMLTAGVDIGSCKISCVAGMYDDETKLVKIFGATSAKCDGIKCGAVVDIQKATMSMHNIFDEIEEITKNRIKNIVIAIRGNFIKSKNSRGIANVSHSDGEITHETIINALENAKKQIKIDSDQEIFQIIPREYILNQQNGIQNPIGMSGAYIEVDAHCFMIPSSNIGNIMKITSLSGVDFCNRVYGYLAASDVLVTKEEKELGCLVIDFGGLTIGVVSFAGGVIRYVDEIYDGSDYITRDIGHKLRASYSVSNEIKETYGAAFKDGDFKNEEFEYIGVDGNTIRKCDSLELIGVIMPRIDKILYEIKNIVEKKERECGFLSGGIIITGGGSKLPNLISAFGKAFDCSIKIGTLNSSKVTCSKEILNDPSYATAIGCVVYDSLNFNGYQKDEKSYKSKIFPKISKWFEEIF
ncbi:MAG: cell division protein FtsA [Endomicrobium sp.]|jgi:cell division protein FtsA|nr:cell division protein FtsA [Endomicrobium sp.]